MNILLIGDCEQTNILKKHIRKDIHVICTDFFCEKLLDDIAFSWKDDLIILFNPECYIELEKKYDKSRLIRGYKYQDTLFYNPLNGISDEKYDGLIFGMSHSQAVINEKLLTTGNYFKVSSPSMDMFCHYKYLEKVSESINCDIVSTIILEIPYYIFNYDLSRFGSFVYTKLNYFDIVDDFHNFGFGEQSSDINEFRMYKSVLDLNSFEKNPVSIEHVSKLRSAYRNLKVFVKASMNNDNVWNKKYTQTIEENKDFYYKFLNLIKRRFVNAKLIILITPFNPAFRLFHKKQIFEQKKIFFEIVSNTGIVINDFELYNKCFYFADHCHIKKCYSELYSNHILSMLQKMELKD